MKNVTVMSASKERLSSKAIVKFCDEMMKSK